MLFLYRDHELFTYIQPGDCYVTHPKLLLLTDRFAIKLASFLSLFQADLYQCVDVATLLDAKIQIPFNLKASR